MRRAGDAAVNLFTQRNIFHEYRKEIGAAFANAGSRVSYKKRQMIETSGNRADCVYLVSSGCVKQYFNCRNGVVKIIFLIAPGSMFNEVAWFNQDASYVASEAQTDVELIRIPADEFRCILNADPHLYGAVSRMLAYKLRITMAQLYDLSFNGTEQRLKNLLCRLCVQLGEDVPEGIRIPYVFTQEDLAQMISASRSNVSRVLCKFRSEGYIFSSSKYIVIRPEAMKLEMQ